ncbi:MAG: hypothetical protein F6J93_23395 [Oscillatoria sp. SIO1A7]|nr:hypothetical protein [Oscillatoria sp. SIO1A7]
MTLQYQTDSVKTISGVLGEKRSSSYGSKPNLSDVQEPIASAPPEVREMIVRVLQLEKSKLYQKAPRNINEDILKIIKELIQ